MKQKAELILGVLTSIFVIVDEKRSSKMNARGFLEATNNQMVPSQVETSVFFISSSSNQRVVTHLLSVKKR